MLYTGLTSKIMDDGAKDAGLYARRATSTWQQYNTVRAKPLRLGMTAKVTLKLRTCIKTATEGRMRVSGTVRNIVDGADS